MGRGGIPGPRGAHTARGEPAEPSHRPCRRPCRRAGPGVAVGGQQAAGGRGGGARAPPPSAGCGEAGRGGRRGQTVPERKAEGRCCGRPPRSRRGAAGLRSAPLDGGGPRPALPGSLVPGRRRRLAAAPQGEGAVAGRASCWKPAVP